jgi:polyhydroxybutyrate depolymerase
MNTVKHQTSQQKNGAASPDMVFIHKSTLYILLVIVVTIAVYIGYRFFLPVEALTPGPIASISIPVEPSTLIQKQEVTHNEKGRTVYMYVPESTKRSNSVPAIILLHGYGGDARSFLTRSGFMPVADEHGVVLVAPEGIGLSWNVEYCCGISRKNDIDDTGYIAAIASALKSNGVQDVFLAGYSNGGILSYMTASMYPELFRAIAPVAATAGGRRFSYEPFLTPNTLEEPVPAIIIHGKQDTVIPYGGGVSPVENIETYSAYESAELWARGNGCHTDETDDVVLDTFTLNMYFCPPDAAVEMYTVIGTGHTWEHLIGDVSSTELIWQFFAQYTGDTIPATFD